MSVRSGRQNQGELGQARAMLHSHQAKLDQVRAQINEKKSEMREIDHSHHVLEATGDINRMMAIKSKSIALSKDLSMLSTTEAETVERVASVNRYIETLKRRLESLQKEESALAEKLSSDDLTPDARATIVTLTSRLRMQIESLEGKS